MATLLHPKKPVLECTVFHGYFITHEKTISTATFMGISYFMGIS